MKISMRGAMRAASYAVLALVVSVSLPAVPARAAPTAPSDGASRLPVEAISGAILEVVVRKPKGESLTFERPLPLDRIPYQIRKDDYYPVGTAFAIGPNRWVTAAHVLDLGSKSLLKAYRLRDAAGKVYDIGEFQKYSLHRDFAVFSIKGDHPVKPLPTFTAPRLNEKVFAVGNALGEGIVYRDGLFTSRTPEERDGKWEWIRFSAAASPGNSGGPLLDEHGRVIGLVQRKSENENLNYALPIGEVLGAKDLTADIDTDILYGINNMANAVARDRLKLEIALPKSYAELDAALTPVLNGFGQRLKDRLFREQAARIFPNGDTSVALLHSTYNAVVPGIIGRGADNNWDAFFSKETKKRDLGANGHLVYGELYGTDAFLLMKPDDVKLAQLYSDSKLEMDLMLRGYTLYRDVGGESIRIVSMGKANEESTYTDAYGRKWLVRLWEIPDVDQRVALFALPVPGGLAGMMLRVPASEIDGHLIDLRAFADFFYLSYYGTLAQWQELLAQRDLLPAAFADVHLNVDYGKRFEYASKRLSFSYGPEQMAITPHSDLKLQFSYFLEGGRAVWDVAQVAAGDDKDNSTAFIVARNTRPDGALDDKFKVRWDKIAGHKAPYDKSAFGNEQRMIVADVVPGKLARDKLTQAPLLYTALYAHDGKAEKQSVEAKFDAFLKGVTVREY